MTTIITMQDIIKNCVICKRGETPLKEEPIEFKKFLKEKTESLKFFVDALEARGKKVAVDFDWLNDAGGDATREIERVGSEPFGKHAHDATMAQAFKKYGDFFESQSQKVEKIKQPIREFFDKLMPTLRSALKDTLAAEPKETVEAKAFAEARTYPTVPRKQRSTAGKTIKIFQKGKWEEVPADGFTLAEKIKAFMLENPSASYEEAAVACERELLEGTGELYFAEKPKKDAESNVPQEIVDEFSKIPFRGIGISLSKDGKWVRLANGKIMPVDNEGAADTKKIMEDSLLASGAKRFKREEVIPVKGFSEDRKKFTDSRGNSFETYEGTNEELEDIEVFSFQIQFEKELRVLSFRDRDRVATRAIRVLRSAEIEPMKANSEQVAYALRAATANDEKFDATLRYVEAKPFDTLQKNIIAALA